MATRTATRNKPAAATTTTTRSRKVPSPAATNPAQVPVPTAPRKPAVAKANGKKPKVSIHAHFIPGKVAMATMTPEKLKELAFISTYSTRDPQSTSPHKEGYQREPMAERFPGIGRYYAKDDNRNRIPALIVSARLYNPDDQTKFNQLFAKGDIAGIHKEFGRSVFSMVDGQHRMGGLYWAWEKLEDFNADIPLMIYYGLHYTEEANFFDDINTNQRKLPKALIEATKVHMEAGSKSHDQFIREVAYSLAKDGDSVWKNQINMTGGKPKKGEPKLPVSYEGLRRSTASMLHTKVVTRLQDRKLRPDKVAKKYWEMVSKACAVAWDAHGREAIDEEGFIGIEPVSYKLKDLAGVGAVSKLGADIISTSLEKGKTEEDFWSSMADLVSRLSQVDWEKRKDNPWVATSAGFAGATGLYDLLYALVYLDKAPGEAVEADER